VAARRPRLPPPDPAVAGGNGTSPRRRHRRRLLPALVLLVVLGVLAAGGYVAVQSVYFVGTDARGLVTMYRGLPYQLPAGINLYSSYYVSGVGAATLSRSRRSALLDHKWLTEKEAGSLVHSIELEELNE
jgi:hypothetical protein